MSIYLNEHIFAIVRKDNGKLELKTFPLVLDGEPSEYELRKHHDYSTSLGEQYCSALSYVSANQPLYNVRERRAAIAFDQTTSKIRRENNVVAISHRKGGWKSYEWRYNDDITFQIMSNFGYGSASYLCSQFFYKGLKLTPFSHFIVYRYANYCDVMRYTYDYSLVYQKWETLMRDTLTFYNAVVDNQENEVFRWIRAQLSQIVDGLERLCNCYTTYWFKNPNGGASVGFSGDDLTVAKAEKISGSVEFLTNIETLPSQVSPEVYVGRLKAVLDKYLIEATHQKDAINRTVKEKKSALSALNESPLVRLYDRLYQSHYYNDSWFAQSNKRKMFHYLITLNQKLGSRYDRAAIREGLKTLGKLLKQRDELKSAIRTKEAVLDAVEKALEVLTGYLNTQAKSGMAKSA